MLICMAFSKDKCQQHSLLDEGWQHLSIVKLITAVSIHYYHVIYIINYFAF